MKNIMYLLCLVSILSCKGQNDLSQWQYGQKIPVETKGMEKDSSFDIPLPMYAVKDLSKFKYKGIKFKNDSVKFKGEAYVPQNKLMFAVDSYDKSNYLGFELHLISDTESKEFLKLLQKEFKAPIKQYKTERESGTMVLQYLWVNDHSLAYYYQHNEGNHKNIETGKKQISTTTEIIILKKGLKTDPSIILNDKRNNPEVVKELFRQNPNLFDPLELLKSRFPD